GVGLALGGAAALRAPGLAPLRVGLERRGDAAELDVLGQHDGQLVLRHRERAAAGAIDDRDRASPVALPAYAPVAQAEVHLARGAALGLEAGRDGVERLVEVQAVELAGVEQPAALR